MTFDPLQASLDGLPLGDWRYFDSLGSTNDAALKWADEGAPDFALVVADTQTAGRGRLQRRWVTNPGAGLAFSLVLRPSPGESEHLERFSPLGAIAVRQALADRFGLAAEIKWPNDVLLARRKVAGVLTETAWLAATLHALVLGIGVNIRPAALPPPDELIFPATCVETELGKEVVRWQVLRMILESLFAWRARLCTAAFLQEWQTHLAFKNEWVRLDATGGKQQIGQVLGIAPDGNLHLIGKDGKDFWVVVGDVHLRSMDEQAA